ncbi:MAG TPA: hypothetical protein VL357_02140 [Rariglobus sp.]|jgi:hypothetical protein|nr:hypothetical protein [Rariglobus sp.]
MNLRTASLLLLLTGGSSLFADSTPEIKSSAPIKNFRLPTFDKNGFRTSFMRADEATIVTNTQIDAKNMNLTLFTDDGSGRIDCILISPSATAYTDKQIVKGRESVRFMRDDVEVTGDHWTYFHQEKRVLIENNAHVTFRDELKDIIK